MAAAQNPFGTAGNLSNVGAGFDPSTLPSWLGGQFYQGQGSGTTGGDTGQATGPQWQYNNLKDQSGNSVSQWGSPNAGSGTGNGSLKPGTTPTYDPVLGWVVPTNSIISGQGEGKIMAEGLGLVLGAGALGASGLFGNLGGGAGAAASTGSGIDVGGAVSSGVSGGAAGAESGLASGVAGGAGTTAATAGGSSLLSTLNTARQGAGLFSSVMKLLGGGGNVAGSGTDTTTGGNDPGLLGTLGSLLGIAGLGRSSGLFGGGTGTPSGATDAAGKAAALSDPWGTSGGRASFDSAITPASIMGMLGQGPGGYSSMIANNPGYQFSLAQGTGAINAGDAAQGSLRSGNRGVELSQFGTGLANTYQNQYFNQGLSSAQLMGQLGGAMGQGSPAAAGSNIMSGFTGATNLQNGANGLFSGLGSGALGSGLSSLGSSLGGLLSSGVNGITSLLSSVFGDTGGTSTGDIFSSLQEGIPLGSMLGNMTSGSSDLSDMGGSLFDLGFGAGW